MSSHGARCFVSQIEAKTKLALGLLINPCVNQNLCRDKNLCPYIEAALAASIKGLLPDCLHPILALNEWEMLGNPCPLCKENQNVRFSKDLFNIHYASKILDWHFSPFQVVLCCEYAVIYM